MSLELKGVRKSYTEPDGTKLPILDVEHFAMEKGEQVVLVGESGGGKTTLLNVISGITQADAGTIAVDGYDLTGMMEVKRDRFRAERIGFVFQTFNLLDAFTALENVMLGMSFAGNTGGKKVAQELLERVGLGHRLHHRPGTLSVGEQQRVAVARSLANQPSLLLADEPTANVDVKNQELVLKLIRDACSERNVSLLLVTHSLDVAGQFERTERLGDFNKPGGSK